MLYTKFAIVAAFTTLAVANPAKGGNGGKAAGSAATAATAAAANNNAAGGAALTLDAAAVQTGSASTGQGAIGSDAGQASSDTSTDNFINFCSGKTLTNGLQQVGGSCNGIVMGDIPAKTNMISSTILFPTTGGQSIQSDTTFNITVQVANLVAGSFTDADTTYYSAPQALQGGNVIGHTHVTVQDMGNNLNPQTTLDPTKFAFFKGINDAGNGKGTLSATVTDGLPAGNYRVCTMTSSSNHQPVLMPVAQRGSQDDCTKFVVSGNGNVANAASDSGSKGIAAAAAVSEAVVGATNSAFAASVIASESAAAAAAADTAAAATTAAAAKGGNAGKGAAAGGATAATTAAAAKGGKAGKGAAAAGGATSATAVAAAGNGSAANGASTASAVAATNTAAAAAAGGAGAATGKGKGAAGKGVAGAGAAGASGFAGGKPAQAGGQAGKGFGRGRKQRFAKREFVA